MATVTQVAEWLVEEIMDNEIVYQKIAIKKIAQQFGDAFLYHNTNGNVAISREVLKEFRKIKEDHIIWNNGERSWRLVER